MFRLTFTPIDISAEVDRQYVVSVPSKDDIPVAISANQLAMFPFDR